MTSIRKGRRAEAARLQNVPTINPAQLWLAGLTPAGRKGMQSQLRLCAGILLPGSDTDNYPWQMLNYTGVMLVRAHMLDAGYAVATVNMALSALKSVAMSAFSMGLLDADMLERIRTVRRVSGDGCRQGRALAAMKSEQCWRQQRRFPMCAVSANGPFCCFCVVPGCGRVSWLP